MGSFVRRLERWRLRGVLVADPDALPALAERFAAVNPDPYDGETDESAYDLLEWLGERDEVDEIFG